MIASADRTPVFTGARSPIARIRLIIHLICGVFELGSRRVRFDECTRRRTCDFEMRSHSAMRSELRIDAKPPPIVVVKRLQIDEC